MTKHKNTVHLTNLGAPSQSPVPSATTPAAKNAARDKIQRQTEEFLAAGGEINEMEIQRRTDKRFSYHGSDIAKGRVGR